MIVIWVTPWLSATVLVMNYPCVISCLCLIISSPVSVPWVHDRIIVISSSVGNLGYRIMRIGFTSGITSLDDVTADPRSHYLSRHLVLFLLFFFFIVLLTPCGHILLLPPSLSTHLTHLTQTSKVHSLHVILDSYWQLCLNPPYPYPALDGHINCDSGSQIFPMRYN